MKYFIFILFLVSIGCKTESKTKAEQPSQTATQLEAEPEIDPSVYHIWEDYIELHPEFKGDSIPPAEFFHNNRADANRLAALTRNGKKKASSGLYQLYQHYQVDLPKVGDKQIVTDFDGKAQAIIENKNVDTIPFNKISAAYAALDMGTPIEPLAKWKKAHWNFFKNFLDENESAGQLNAQMLIVCVTFDTLLTRKPE